MRILITCPFGFVSTLNQELKYLRFSPIDSFDTWTYVDTDLAGMMMINLRSRIASKVYIQLQEAVFCDTFDNLFTLTQEIDRTQRLPATEFLSLQAHSFQSTLQSEKSIQSIVHKAILTQVMTHSTPLQDPTPDPYEIMVQLINNKATFFLNTSGDGLHKRGYRLDQGAASLKENVAAGLILMSGRRRQQRLRDPCCGSGTICIEAAQIARNIAPGGNRQFAFQWFVSFDPSVRTELKTVAQAKSYPDKKFVILGSDNDPEMLEKAVNNAERAGVADTIEFFEHDLFHQLPEHLENTTDQQTVIVTNPPYGKRLAPEWLKDIYRSLVNLSKDDATHFTCITSYPEFSHLLTTRRPRKEVKNGQDDVHVWIKPRG
jgi:putative N6-adenine-specific DNA methylase